ncbi:MAG TPA: hypothetical protein VFF65_09545 [Phycisphaerales bacterium]|nr:hypothetical protein [Phycisphaerales bacterium]
MRELPDGAAVDAASSADLGEEGGWVNRPGLLRARIVEGGTAGVEWAAPMVVELLGPGWRPEPGHSRGPLVGVFPEHIAGVWQVVEKAGFAVPAVLRGERGGRVVLMRVKTHRRGRAAGAFVVSPCDAEGEWYTGARERLDFDVEVPEAWLVPRDDKGVAAMRVAVEAARSLEEGG